MTRHIAIASCDALLPDGDVGDFPLIAALRARGHAVSVVAWSADSVKWDEFDVTVIRSTWDYTGRRQEFTRWLTSTPRLLNPASTVIANTDQRYLAELIDAGLPVIPTEFAEPGQPVRLPPSGQFVVKPSVGAGSRGAGRFDAGRPGELDRARAHAERLHSAGRTVLVQPYLVDVDEPGETDMIFLDGIFSHAIRKGRMLAGGAESSADSPALYVEENISPRRPSPSELAVARAVLERLSPDGPLLYARIDVLPSSGGPLLIEAELAEPSLFLHHSPTAADQLADAILNRAR